MDRPETRRPRRSLGLRAALAVVAFAAMVLALVAQSRRAALREARLVEELRAERHRAQGYRRLARMALEGGPAIPLHALSREYREEEERFRREAVRLRTGQAPQVPPDPEASR